MRFLKQNHKTTTLLFLVLLFVYISYLGDNIQKEVTEIVCWIKGETIPLNELIKSDNLIRYEDHVVSGRKTINLISPCSNPDNSSTTSAKYIKYFIL